MADKPIPRPETVEFQATDRQLDRFYPTPDIKVLIDPATREKLRTFQANLLSYLESFRTACKAARPNLFDEQVDRDARKSASQLELSIRQDTYDVDESQGDGYASFMGITHGLTAQSSRAAAAMLSRQLITNHVKPFIVLPSGSTQESNDIVDLLTSMLEDLLFRGKFESKVRSALAQVPNAKVVALRYRMSADSNLLFDPSTQAWTEAHGDLKPVFEVWPIENLYVSNPNEADPELQEGIFWTSVVTLLDLRANECVLGKPGKGGRFRNLEELQNESEAASRLIDEGGYNRASLFPQMGMVEYEGALPFSRFVRDGLFTPELAEVFGVFGPQGEDDASLIEWGRALERIPVWCVSYISSQATPEFTGVGSSTTGDHLLQCEPCRGIRGRNSLFIGRFHQVGNEFYGQSLAELCNATEKCLDRMLNNYFRTTDFNANPAVFFDFSRVRDMTAADVKKALLTPGEIIPLKPLIQGNDIEKILKYAKLPDIPNVMEMMAYFKSVYDQQTGITAMSRGSQGQTDTGTLGELEIMQSQSTQEVDERILAIAQEFSRLFSRIIEDFMFFMGTGQEMIDYLARVSGMEATRIQKILPSLHPLSEEYRIEHPIQAQQDMAVRATLLMKCMEMFPDVLTDRAEALRILVEASGMPRIARRLLQTQRLLTPEDEHQQMRVGNYVSPNPMENLMLHLQAHQREQQILASVSQSLDPNDPASKELLLEVQALPGHIQETVEMIQAMQAMQPPPNPGGENSEGSQKKVAPEGQRPANSSEVATNTQNEAMGRGGENNAPEGGI